MFTGCMTALITPFAGGDVDHRALADLIEAQIAGGVHGVVPCGSTGEAATLTHDEHIATEREAGLLVRGRVPVLAGPEAITTDEAIRLQGAPEGAGADCVRPLSTSHSIPDPVR